MLDCLSSQDMTRENGKVSVTLADVAARLRERSLKFSELDVGRQARVIISERGGRVFGPFVGDGQRESILWLNPAFRSRTAFSDFLGSSEGWNLGGERFWVAPELQYHIADRNNFWASYHLPESIDPGQWVLDTGTPGEIHLRQEMRLKAYNLAFGEKGLRVVRRYRPSRNPLRYSVLWQELDQKVRFAGYEQEVTLTEEKTDDIMSESWILSQIRPSGCIYIPCTGALEHRDYFEPIDSSLQVVSDDHVQLKITGARRYKVGYLAAHVFGRVGYVSRLDDEKWYLVVRSFYNDPSSVYAEEAPNTPGRRGESVHIYNDDGKLGGFGELECHGHTIGGETGSATATDHFAFWLYLGEYEAIRNVVFHLLGVKVNGRD